MIFGNLFKIKLETAHVAAEDAVGVAETSLGMKEYNLTLTWIITKKETTVCIYIKFTSKIQNAFKDGSGVVCILIDFDSLFPFILMSIFISLLHIQIRRFIWTVAMQMT